MPVGKNLPVFILDWVSGDEETDIIEDDITSEDSCEKDKYKPREFIIRAYGRLSNSKTVTINITGFKPFFFLKIPEDWDDLQVRRLISKIRNGVKFKPGLYSWEIVYSKPFTHFTGDEKYKYLKLVFYNYGDFNKYKNFLVDKVYDGGENRIRNPPQFNISGVNWSAITFESNMPPMIRFYHLRNIYVTGWSEIRNYRKIPTLQMKTMSNYELECDWRNIFKPGHDVENRKFPATKIVAFDIEASSSHGDFPVAKKNYHKLANDVIRSYKQIIKFSGDESKRHIQTWLELAFTKFYNNNQISPLPIDEKVKHHIWTPLNTIDIDSNDVNVLPSAFQFADVASDIYNIFKEYLEEVGKNYGDKDIIEKYGLVSKCQRTIGIFTSKFNIELPPNALDLYSREIIFETIDLYRNNDPEYLESPIDNITFLLKLGFCPNYRRGNINRIYLKNPQCSLDFKILRDLSPIVRNLCRNAYRQPKQDEHIVMLRKIFDRYLPTPAPDQVIQIGSTFKLDGETDCYLKHIICLKSCSPINNNELVKHEHKNIQFPKGELVLELGKRNINIDIKDLVDHETYEKYNRKLNNIRYESQLQSDKAKVVVESYETETEVLLAWTKIIQSENPDMLTGYNLTGFDFKFMYERADDLGILDEFLQLGRKKGKIEALNIKGKGNIQRGKQKDDDSDDSSSNKSDGEAYITMEGRCVVDLFKIMKGQYNLDSYKLDAVCKKFLYMGKNDLPPRQIFIKQRGNAVDRRDIAEYCLVDCILCNRLMDRLQVFMANFGMSRVCHVPLSFLFTRGQGVKVQSIIGKVCLESGYLIEDRHDKIRSTEKYEGAIVLDPDPEIYLSKRVQRELSDGSNVTDEIDEPVSVSDFNSLYPSSMISENLSHDSFVDPDTSFYKAFENEGVPGYSYVDVVYDLYEVKSLTGKKKDLKKHKIDEKVCRYAQPLDGSKSIVPRTLQQLLKARKDTRKLQKNYPKGSFEWNIYECLQLAYKITANSIYGQIGNKVGPIYKVEIASCTTAVGRNLITGSRDFVEKIYPGTRVVYGDSVTYDTPIILRNPDTEEIDIINIGELCDSWDNYKEFKPFDTNRSSKQQGKTIYEVWTDDGWAKIKRVIRHKTRKQIHRVNTYRGVIDVTEDHSLLTRDGVKIKPDECNGSTELLHSFPNEFNQEFEIIIPAMGIKNFVNSDVELYKCSKCEELYPSNDYYYQRVTRLKQCEQHGRIYKHEIQKIQNIYRDSYTLTREEAWIWGFFFGDGSCDHNDTGTKSKWTWALNNNNMDRLNQAIEYLKIGEPDIEFKIDTIESSGVYKLVPTGGGGTMIYMVNKYLPMFYDSEKYKKVPKCILNAPREIKEWFLRGYYEADGCKTCDISINNLKVQFVCKGKIGAQGLYYLFRSLNYENMTVNMQNGRNNIYFISTLSNAPSDKLRRQNIKLRETDENEYVYDLETETGKFHASVGEITVKNTDSIFIKFISCDRWGKPLIGLDAIFKSMELCVESSFARTKELKAPHNLEFEKTIWPFILFIKKRYCGNYYTDYASPKFSFKSMGIELKRRDNAPVLKRVYGGIIDRITLKHSLDLAINYFKSESLKIINGEYPDNLFLESRSYSGNYKNPDQIAHAVLADRIGKREVGNKIQGGDRIFYYHIVSPEYDGKRKLLTGEKIETPEYVKTNNLQIDYFRYLEKEIFPAVKRLFALTDIDIERIFRYLEAKSNPYRKIKLKKPKAEKPFVKTRSIFALKKKSVVQK